MEAVIRKSDSTIIWINGAGKGYQKRSPDSFDTVKIPDQDVSKLFTDNYGPTIKTGLKWPEDLVQYTPEEIANTPDAALVLLAARPIEGETTVAKLRERIGLIEIALRLTDR